MPNNFPSLEKKLMLYDFVEKQYISEFFRYDNGILYIPRGIGIKNVIDLIKIDSNVKINYTKNMLDENKLPSIKASLHKFSFKSPQQENACKFLLSESARDPQSKIVLDTGMGKTFCGIYTIAHLKFKSIIISGNLSEQWRTRIVGAPNQKGFLNIDPDRVVILKGYKSMLDVFNNVIDADIYCASTRTLIQYFEIHKLSLEEWFQKAKIGLKIIDESHINFHANVMLDLHSSAKTIYMTATPGRSNSLEDFIYKYIYQSVGTFGNSINNIFKYHNLIMMEYKTNPTYQDVIRCETKKGFNQFKYFIYIRRLKSRLNYWLLVMTSILSRLLKTFDESDKIMLIIPSIKLIDILYTHIKSKFDIEVGRYCSGRGKDELKNKVILSTVNSSGTGLDLKNLRAIISNSQYRSKNISQQLLGRLRFMPKKNVYFIDVIDTAFPQLIEMRKHRIRNIKSKLKDISVRTINERGEISSK